MIRTILVALDRTERAPAVLSLAAEVAERFDASMVLFRAIQVPQEFPPAAHVGHDPLPAYLHAEAEAELSRLAAGLPRVRPQHVITEGRSWATILEAAEQVGADLIVIGSHAYDWLERVTGTVPGRIVTHARCHVLVAHVF